jgi:hypothetical protein
MAYEQFQAKRTFYHGTWFKSNLEARVAQAFTTLGMPYEYERQCFRDERFPYEQFTPDFHLPNTDAYVEVCGSFDQRHRSNVHVLCEIVGSTRDDPSVLVINSRGDVFGYYVESGEVGCRQAAWELPSGGKTMNVFDAAGMKRW